MNSNILMRRLATRVSPHNEGATRGRITASAVLALTVAAGLALGAGGAFAKGGTAKPPGGGGGGVVVPPAAGNPSTPTPPPITVNTGAIAVTTHGFDQTGFLQNATLTAPCTATDSTSGGTATVNGITITIPKNLILQFPANTLSWCDMFTPSGGAALTQDGMTTPALEPGTPAAPAPTFRYGSIEFNVVGNVVAGEPIAGLIVVSQLGLMGGAGYITSIDYAAGVLYVGNSLGGADQVRLQINDPVIPDLGTGRYSAGQSPDTRFQVDQGNPTIKSATGYPMCIPRNGSKGAQGLDDPRCPNKNRPLGTSPACRNFTTAGITGVVGGDPAGFAGSVAFDPGKTICTGFVMKYSPGDLGRVVQFNGAPKTIGLADIAAPTDPDSREQVPLAVGDRINYSGTLLIGDTSGPVTTAYPGGSPTISVHTIEANVGIWTSPGSMPVYIALGQFGVSSDTAAAPTSVTGLRQEAQNRLVVEASVTDVQSIVDVYFIDLEPTLAVPRTRTLRNGTVVPILPGEEINRWLTPGSMTGGVGGVGSNGAVIDGGITTQLVGPQPGRARIRANKAVPGILVSPTRYIRAVVRTLCDPYNINEKVAVFPAQAGVTAPCIKRAIAANGLATGQYLAPVFEYIFPENVVAGDPIVPYDFWSLGFLSNGEGGSGAKLDTLGPGGLSKTPW